MSVRWAMALFSSVILAIGADAAVLQDKPKIKKMRAHFVGSKRPHENELDAHPPAKKSTKVKNKWISSKTYPKKREVNRQAPRDS